MGEHTKQELDSLSLSSLGDLKQPLQMISSANMDSSNCESIKNILKCLGSADISQIMEKVQEKQRFPAFLSSDPTAVDIALPSLSDPAVQQALESLHSLIKATKEKHTKREGSGTSQTSSDKHEMGNADERKRDKQARTSKMESLIKELEGLMKEDGLCFLTPVIGFYCQKCHEFIGDLNSAENHAVIHYNCNSSNMDQYAGDSKTHLRYCSSSNNQHPCTSGRRDHRDYGYHSGSGDHRIHRDYQDWRDKRDDRNKHSNDHRSHRARQEAISLKEEMRKERMLITVSCGLTPPPDLRVAEEVKKKLYAIGSHSKVRAEDSDSKEKDKVKVESGDSSDNVKVKTQIAKSPKKKKKKKDKKKKDKKDKS